MIARIFIPASVTELKDGWLGEIWSNISITISSENLNYKNFENKMIVVKSNPANDEFDSLILFNCDVSELTVPSSIKYITSYSLYHSKLNVIEFSVDSELLSIGRMRLSQVCRLFVWL